VRIGQEQESYVQQARSIAKRFFRHENAVLGLILVGLIALFGVLSKGYSVTVDNLINVGLQSSTRGVAAIGQAFVILTAGIDVSVGGLALFAMSAAAIMMRDTSGFPTGIVILALLIGAAIGASNGAAISRVGMPPLIVTLAVWSIMGGGALVITRGYTIVGLPRAFDVIGQGHIAGIPVPVIIFIAVAVVGYFVLYYTTFGRSVYAVGGNAISSWLSGVNVRNVQFIVYVISGFLASVAGLITLSRTMCASMGSTSGLELDSIAAVVIGGISLSGGRGNLIGVVIGSLIIGVINNGMSILLLPAPMQEIIKGVVIYLAVGIDYMRRRNK
jgi:ribose/xylose/arabinose/galactoside ABC-type transport system permease subunit